MKVIASHNGIKAVSHAWELLQEGASALDACVAAVGCVEDDPQELTVGYGGLPNERGVVELDAAVMDGRTHRVGAVAALRNIRHPTQVAKLVMQRTQRVLLAGEGALEFARANGFPEENLLTDQARRMWLYWKRATSQGADWVAPRSDEADAELRPWFEKHFYGQAGPEGSRPAGPLTRSDATGTVHCAALDQQGHLACATSTSGHAFKMAGRVGDSPIAGAGLYVDDEVGSCGSIGHGEANLENLSCFASVLSMEGGLAPQEATQQSLRRVVRKLRADQCDERRRPRINLQLFALSREGQHAGSSLWSGKQLAVADQAGVRLEDCIALFDTDS